MAAVAYDVAALALKGPSADLNFPNSASSLPVPASTAPRDIQAAATSAAAAIGAAAAAMGLDGNLVSASREKEDGEGDGGGCGEELVEERFVDEDMIIDMPNILMNMAEGMLLTPPSFNFNMNAPNDFEYPPTYTQDTLWDFP